MELGQGLSSRNRTLKNIAGTGPKFSPNQEMNPK